MKATLDARSGCVGVRRCEHGAVADRDELHEVLGKRLLIVSYGPRLEATRELLHGDLDGVFGNVWQMRKGLGHVHLVVGSGFRVRASRDSTGPRSPTRRNRRDGARVETGKPVE